VSVKVNEQEILIDKRAHALAVMLLTRRKDLLIEEVKDDIGLDYIVRFYTEGKDGLREFGVQLKGTLAAATKDDADNVLCPSMQQRKQYGPFVRPVCLFLFTMDNDEGWYTWVAEPIEVDGKALLRSCAEPDCQQLDKRALREIIDRVDGWHDAIFLRLVVNGPGGGKSDRRGAKK
jgi:hypothetical protein